MVRLLWLRRRRGRVNELWHVVRRANVWQQLPCLFRAASMKMLVGRRFDDPDVQSELARQPFKAGNYHFSRALYGHDASQGQGDCDKG